MTDPGVLALLERLGIAGIMVGLLMMQLRAADTERREITTKFLATLETTIKANADGAAGLSSALSSLTQAINDRAFSASAEHQRHLEVLNDLVLQIRSMQERQRNGP